MADDPNLKHVDSRFVSRQPHEYHYFKDQIKQEFPKKSDDEFPQKSLPSAGRQPI